MMIVYLCVCVHFGLRNRATIDGFNGSLHINEVSHITAANSSSITFCQWHKKELRSPDINKIYIIGYKVLGSQWSKALSSIFEKNI